MANIDITLKRKLSSGEDILHPTTNWGQVESKPSTFTPTAHNHIGSDISDSNPSYFINNATGSSGVWTATVSGITSLYDGLYVIFKLPSSGGSTCWLNINGLGSKQIFRYSTSALTTHFNTNYIIPLVYDSILNGGCWVIASDTYYSSEDYNMRWENSLIMGADCNGYHLLMQGIDGKMYPVTAGGDGSSTTNAVSTAELLLGGKMLYFGTSANVVANQSVGSSYFYEGEYSGEGEYWMNQASGWATAGLPFYIVGSLNANGNFVLDNASYTSFLTQDLPTTDDGKLYIQVGFMNDTWDAWRLQIDHPIYQYKDGKLRLYIPEHTHSEYLKYNPDGDGIAIAYDDSNPTIDGQYVGGGHIFGADGNSANGYLAAKVLFAEGVTHSVDGLYVGSMNKSTGGTGTQVASSNGTLYYQGTDLNSKYLQLSGGTLTGSTIISQAQINGDTSAFVSPHLALNTTTAVDTTGFVGMTFATSTSANYGWSYGAQRTSNGNGDLIWRNHDSSATGVEKMRLYDNGNLTVTGTVTAPTFVGALTGTASGNLTSASSLDPSKVSQTASYRFVTDTEKGTWNGKQDALGFTPYNATNPAGYITASGSITGNAATATKLASARSISLTGDITGTATFDGSANASIDTTIAVSIPITSITNLTSTLAAKAPLDSPSLYGTPTAPTASSGNSSTQIATTAFVQGEISAAGSVSPDLVEWFYVGTSTDGDTLTDITVNSVDLGESFDFDNYDYKFVYDGWTSTEDNSRPYVRLDADSTAGRHSFVYQRVTLTAATTGTESIAGEYGATSTYIDTGVELGTVSTGTLTQSQIEFIISRGRQNRAGYYTYLVRGDGAAAAGEYIQTDATTYSGTCMSRFSGSYASTNSTLTQIYFYHSINFGSIDANKIAVYKRRKQ